PSRSAAPIHHPTFSRHCDADHQHLHPFPTRRSSDLIRKSLQAKRNEKIPAVIREFLETGSTIDQNARTCPQPSTRAASTIEAGKDRKSTRLNSSHGSHSYAVFWLKKKKLTGDGTVVG